MTIKLPKRAPIPRVSIHNLSFEPNLTNIFKYLVLKTSRQNSLVGLILGLKNCKSSEFCRLVLDSKNWNTLIKMISNDRLQIETLGIGVIFSYFRAISSQYIKQCQKQPFCANMPKYDEKGGIFSHCVPDAFQLKPINRDRELKANKIQNNCLVRIF